MSGPTLLDAPKTDWRSKYLTRQQMEDLADEYEKTGPHPEDEIPEDPFTFDRITFTSGEQFEDFFTAPRVRPSYPIEVWEGTVVGEFAKLCAADNNVPRKMYAEAFRTVLGAVVGDRLRCSIDGAIPRAYTILIAPKGKGKGTSVRRAVKFFEQSGSGLLFHGNCIYKSQGIGALHASASSAPGMVKLTHDGPTIKGASPLMTWGGTLPRVLSVHEELKTFLSSLFIEGGTGKALDGVVCSLWDDTSFTTQATDKRTPGYGEMQFSLLGAVTEEDWFDLLGRSDAVGGGLMSRLNLIGTEGGYEQVATMEQPDFTALQESFLPRVHQLADAPCHIAVTEEARYGMQLFTKSLPDGCERMNVHAWRSALLLAWLHHEPINQKWAGAGILLANYQVQSHEYYRTHKADNPLAAIQAKIVRALSMGGPTSKRELQHRTHASRSGTEWWNRAFDGLLKAGQIRKREDGKFSVG